MIFGGKKKNAIFYHDLGIFGVATFFSLVFFALHAVSDIFASNCDFHSQVTAVYPVGEGQCIALGYESPLPLVLLTLQGGDTKPYEFPTEGTKAMAGRGMIDVMSSFVWFT